MNKLFRFHAPAGSGPSKAVRRLLKRYPKSDPNPTFLAADTEFITDSRGRWPIESFADFERVSYITLTRKEADLIALANPGVRPPRALEALHPWLPQQVYRESSARNFKALETVLKRYGQHLVAPAAFCDEKWNKVCNAVRMKTDLDARFYSAWHLPIQDTYVLEERRSDRSVIAIDVNAMYPSCMQQAFPKPSKMQRMVYDREIVPGEALPAGLFRCTLQGPSSQFIRRYNPFRKFFAGRYLRAALDERLLVDLNEFEVEFYLRHFDRIHVADAVVSDHCIPHPLARDAKRLFTRRMNYLSHNNKALADREKFLSTLLSSSTHRPSRSRQTFKSSSDAEDYLRQRFGIVLGADDPSGLSSLWLRGRKGLSVIDSAEGVFCEAPSLTDGSACFVFNQRIVARSRIVLLSMMEKISQIAPDVEICYANVDSIHFSLPTDHLTATLDKLRGDASDRMGGFKIEAVVRNALWLEPGRYWLYSDCVEKFRNRSIGIGRGAFADHSVHVVNRKIGELNIPVRIGIGMTKSMSDARTIIHDPDSGLARQNLVEVGSETPSESILGALERNRMHDIPYRISAFRQLAARHAEDRVSLPRDLTK